MTWSNCVTPDGVATIQCLPVVFAQIINWLLIFAGVIAVVFIIFSGISYITSGGDQKKVEIARKTLNYAILGLIVVFLSFIIINLISFITGVRCITTFGFNC